MGVRTEPVAGSLIFEVEADKAAALAAALVEAGAEGAIVARRDYVFRSRSPLFERLLASLGRGS